MAIDKNVKLYDVPEFDAVFKKVFNEEVLTASEKNLLKDKRVYEDSDLNQQYKYVFESETSGVTGFDMEETDKYYENSNFNSQFTNRMNDGPVTPPAPTPTINPTLYSATLGSTGDAVFTLANVTTLDQVKLESTVLAEGVGYTYASNTLKIPSTVYDPSVLDEEKTLTLTVNTDKTLTAVIKTVGA